MSIGVFEYQESTVRIERKKIPKPKIYDKAGEKDEKRNEKMGGCVFGSDDDGRADRMRRNG
jgi:hypothetical protein